MQKMIVLLIASVSAFAPYKSWSQTPEFSIGQPRVWSYNRVYPFLDGIFQDVASTQVFALTLNPNSANGSRLDATLTSFSAGVAFSPVAGAQNALMQQQNEVVSANAFLQTQLLTQQAQLTQQTIAATQQLGGATANLDRLQSATTLDASAIANAKQQVLLATDRINTLNSQLTTVKAQMPSNLMTAQTLSSPTPPPPNSIALPTSLTQASAPPGASGPNFPASKQMDNQVNLLWERLSRLVSTLSQADNMSGYKFVLISFNIDLMPTKRKKQLFAAEFCVVSAISPGAPIAIAGSKNACPESDDANSPRVIDLFPSASAVNIVDNKYRDNRLGLNAVLSFFSVGFNAAFNREHLQMTQALGQSALITGFGIGTSRFGWAFGRNLGDDVISPGNRTVFAIVAVKDDSKNPANSVSIRVNRAGYFSERAGSWQQAAMDFKNEATSYPWTSACLEWTQVDGMANPTECQLKPTRINQLMYSPTEFDPLATTNSLSALQVAFDGPVDPQMTVSIDGRIIPRARDSFGRAITGAAGSAGLLETSSLTADTWIPVSAKKISLLLNPARLERRFPSIIFASPHIIQGVDEPGTVNFSGVRFHCDDMCASILPPLTFRKSSVTSLVAFDWEAHGKIYISIPSDSNIGQSSIGRPGQAAVQVLTDQGLSPWGATTVVLLRSAKEIFRLNCHPLDSRLECSLPITDPANRGQYKRVLHLDEWSLEVRDTDHAGAPISAWKTSSSNMPDKPFVVWSLPAPVWVSSAGPAGTRDTLVFCVGLVTEIPDVHLSLSTAAGTSSPFPPFNKNRKYCQPPSGATPDWQGELAISREDYSLLGDQMTLVEDSHRDMPAVVLNLRASAAPVVTSISADDLKFAGQNLIYRKIKVGDSGPEQNVSCDPTGSFCSVKGVKDLGKTGGQIYFIDEKGFQLAMVQSGTSTNSPVIYTPKKAQEERPEKGNAKGQFALNLNVTGSSGEGSSAGIEGRSAPTAAPLPPPPNPNVNPTTPPTAAAPPVASSIKPLVTVLQ